MFLVQAMSSEANELLPVFNKTSSRFYRTSIPAGDWSNHVRHLTTGTQPLAQRIRSTPELMTKQTASC